MILDILDQKLIVFIRKWLNELANIRKSTLLRSFINALAHGDSDKESSSIEMNIHDQLRYIGDIFAWIHQSAILEVELLEYLFTDKFCKRKKQKVLDLESLSLFYSKCFEGICKPFKVILIIYFMSNLYVIIII
jgi:hypothetical protein